MKVVKISKKHGRDAYHVVVEVTKAELDKQFPDPLEWGTVSKPHYPKVLSDEELDKMLASLAPSTLVLADDVKIPVTTAEHITNAVVYTTTA